jgi:hypothetical protein
MPGQLFARRLRQQQKGRVVVVGPSCRHDSARASVTAPDDGSARTADANRRQASVGSPCLQIEENRRNAAGRVEPMIQSEGQGTARGKKAETICASVVTLRSIRRRQRWLSARRASVQKQPTLTEMPRTAPAFSSAFAGVQTSRDLPPHSRADQGSPINRGARCRRRPGS